MALAKSRDWRGLTTAEAILEAKSAATSGRWRPPVASRTTRVGPAASWRSFSTSVWMPSSSLVTAKVSPLGSMATSRRALETSMPTWTFSVAFKAHLLSDYYRRRCPALRVRARKEALRPRQLFGLRREFVEGRDDPRLSCGLHLKWGQGENGLSRPHQSIVDRNQNTRRINMRKVTAGLFVSLTASRNRRRSGNSHISTTRWERRSGRRWPRRTPCSSGG